MNDQVFGGEHQSGRPARALWTAMARGLLGRCPNCGKGRLFASYLTTVKQCEHCGEAYIGRPEMYNCVRGCRDCAGLGWLCAAFISRGTQLARDLCQVCARSCDLCADACGQYEDERCRQCVAACRHCAEECRKLVA